ncbi:MAG: class I SAM-dependent methyltransferase [Elusimicrobia bacterium]|nr:class I SAM-dependent methyltransferase [Elusimicrobiota bacterium]
MSDVLARLSRTAGEWGAPLDAAALERVSSYLSLVREKNRETNLTADDAWEDLVLKHAADGAFAAATLRLALAGARAPRVLDLGSGAGFIGIVLKIAWPEAEVTLMESVARKYRFLSAAAARVGLPGLRVLHRTAGAGAALTAYERDHDAVVERALAPLPRALRLAWPLLRPRGIFAAFQSEEPDLSDAALAKALAAAGARVLKSCPYRRPGETRERRLVIFERREE